MGERPQPIRDLCTLEQIADLLDEVYWANGLLADELDRILVSRTAVSHRTIDRFARLADQLRPGARARAELADLDPSRLLAGAKLWMDRNRQRAATDATGPIATSWPASA